MNGEAVDGIFYEEELSVIDKNIPEATYKIDKILKTSGSGSRKNSWVPTSDVQNIYKMINQFYMILPSNSSMKIVLDNILHVIEPNYLKNSIYVVIGKWV